MSEWWDSNCARELFRMTSFEVMEEIKNKYVEAIWESLKAFIENINCLYDSFEYSENMLRSQKIDAQKEYNAFLKSLTVRPGDGPAKLVIPAGKEKQHQHLERKVKRSQESSRLLQRSYIVSMVSQFDAYIGDLLRTIYEINPDKLKQSDLKFNYAELQAIGSIEAAKEQIVDNKIEAILRDSHQDQIKEIASSIGVGTLKEFDNWPCFVEITQRRNLFVHSNGIVSKQYLSICKSEKVELGELKKGDQLEVDRSYFNKAYEVFYEVAVKLSQMTMRVLLYKKDKSCLEDVDKCMITNTFDLIVDERYDVAIELANFALNEQFTHSNKDRMYLVLNRAQAYKWKGDEKKCQELLNAEDFTACSSELKCPKFALEDNLDKVCEMMRSSGKDSEILKPEQYRTWPIFKGMRDKDKFKETFKSIFGEDLEPEVETAEVPAAEE